jgi:hypothetical protein
MLGSMALVPPDERLKDYPGFLTSIEGIVREPLSL